MDCLMDGSWQQIAGSLTHTVRRNEGTRAVRTYPSWRLTSGEVVTTLAAMRDARNVHELTQKQLYRRLVAASQRGEALSPEQLWRST